MKLQMLQKNYGLLMDISYDDFIQTTQERHKNSVEKIFQEIFRQW